MTSSTSFTNKVRTIVALAAVCLLSGCFHLNETERVRSAGNGQPLRIAVFPVDNLSGAFAPLKEVRHAWTGKVRKLGFELLDDEMMEQILAKHRIRYTGGVDTLTARAFREEGGVEAILVTSLEFYSDTFPPKVALLSRLVTTEERPRIKWMDAVAVSGDDAPGVLGLGILNDIGRVQGVALQRLTDSLALWADRGTSPCDPAPSARKYQPKLVSKPRPIEGARKIAVAVVPFYNTSTRRSAGQLSQLHFLRQLACLPNVEAVEPGLLREKMLAIRMVMREGVSTRDVDVLSYVVGADYVLSGTVFDYLDPVGGTGAPRVDITSVLTDKADRKLVFASKSYANGNDDVFFYDVGLEKNAGNLADKMTSSVVQKMELRAGGVKSDKPEPR